MLLRFSFFSSLRLLLWSLLMAGLIGCGVKLPPLAPVHPTPPPSRPKLDCLPTQDDCDATDPNYRPSGHKR